MKDFRTQFRLPNELADMLKREAEGNLRSMNAEIVERLSSTFRENETPPQEQLDRIERKIDQLLSAQNK